MASWPWGSLFRRFCRFCTLWGLTVSLSSLSFPILMHSLGDVWHPGPGLSCFGGFAGFAAFGGSPLGAHSLIGKNREESETVGPQRLQNPPKPPKQGTPGPGCQTSPKECIKIGKNREESETVSPQRLQNPPKPPKQGTPGPGCQT